MSILDTLDKDIARKEQELNKLKAARKLLTIYENEPSIGDEEATQSEATPAPAPLPALSPQPQKREVYGPVCTACDSEMYRARKTVPSGLQIEYWHCSHQGCNNEMY